MTIWPSNPSPGYLLERFLNIYLQIYAALYVALFTVAKVWEQLRCPLIHDWIKKMWYINKMECYSTVENTMETPKKIQTRLTIWPSNSLSGYWVGTWKIWKHLFAKIYALCVQCSVIHSDQERHGNNQCPLMDNWIKKMLAMRKMKYCHLWQHGWTLRILC